MVTMRINFLNKVLPIDYLLPWSFSEQIDHMLCEMKSHVNTIINFDENLKIITNTTYF
jgi:hypothetical protein